MCADQQHSSCTTEQATPSTAAANDPADSSSLSTASEQPEAKHADAAEQPGLASSAQVPTTTPSCTFSITKLAGSGIIMLQLDAPAHLSCSDHASDAQCNSSQPAEAQVAGEVLPVSPSVPINLPVTVVRSIMNDIQAGTLATPE